MAGTEGERIWSNLECGTFVLCMALVQESHAGVLKAVLHCTGLCQTYPEVGALTPSIQDSFDQDKLLYLSLYLAKLYLARQDVNLEQMHALIQSKTSQMASAVCRLVHHLVVFEVAENKDKSKIKSELEVLQTFLPPTEQEAFLSSALDFADQQLQSKATTQDIMKERMSLATPLKPQTPGGFLLNQLCSTPLRSDYGVCVSPILKDGPVPVPFQFDTPSVDQLYDTSSEMTVFKTATSGYGTSMSSNTSKIAKKRSRSSISGISRTAKRKSTGKISNAGKETLHDTTTSGNSTIYDNESGSNSSDATTTSVNSTSYDNESVGSSSDGTTTSGNSTSYDNEYGGNSSDATYDVYVDKVKSLQECWEEVMYLRKKVDAGQPMSDAQMLPVMEYLIQSKMVCVHNF